MASPERIHVNWNAAESFEHFLELGLNIQYERNITAQQVQEVIAQQHGRLFSLGGWVGVAPDITEVFLAIRDTDAAGLTLENRGEPRFIDVYEVAQVPPPRMLQPYGDYLFDLVKVG